MVGRPSIGLSNTGTGINKTVAALHGTASYPQFGDLYAFYIYFLINEIFLEFNFPLMPVAWFICFWSIYCDGEITGNDGCFALHSDK